jgi:hypothetical protein
MSSLTKAAVGAWNSPTLNTWASQVSRLLNVLIFMPLVLSKLEVVEIAVWYLFTTIISFQLLFEFGFGFNFTRFISYVTAPGAASDSSSKKDPISESIRLGVGQCEPQTVLNTVRFVYLGLAAVSLVLMLGVGTPLLWRFYELAENDQMILNAWGVVVIANTFGFYSIGQGATLDGLHRVAERRRWEAVTGLGSVTAGSIAIILGFNFFVVVLAHQGWIVVRYGVYQLLLRQALDERGLDSRPTGTKSSVLRLVWPHIWRNGIGVMISNGVIVGGTMVYSQVGEPARVAGFLLAMRVIHLISSFSQAPFYSRIPELGQHAAPARDQEFLALSRRGQTLALWLFAIGVVSFAWLGEPLLGILKSGVELPGGQIWCMLGFAFFFERVGGMSLVLCALANRMFIHTANAVTGALFLVASFVLFPQLRDLGLSIAFLIGYGGFYWIYASIKAHSVLSLRFPSHLLRTMAGPAALMLVSVLVEL